MVLASVACDMSTILFSHRNGCLNCAHRYDHSLAKADTSAGAGDGCPMYFVNSQAWALGWLRPLKLNEAQRVTCIVYYYYHYYLTCYCLSLLFLLLHCYYNIITHYYIIQY